MRDCMYGCGKFSSVMAGYIISVVFIQLFVILTAKNNAPIVEINQGILKGKYVTTHNGRIVNSFTGIPYAKPPVGNLRFEPPVPAEQWEGVLDASKPHSVCPQCNILAGDFSVTGNEDCLYLNVYTPQLSDTKMKTELLPVMIFIHGGAFLLGSANENLYGPQILLDKDIVLVVPNYRLGPLGFLTTGDEVVPGNNGLKDQSLAIKWVKENIARFGGNSESITLFGQSAGGASSHYHMMSPLSKDLIKGVIALSGTALSVWALSQNDEALQNSRKLANILNCSSNSSLEMVKCLKTIDVAILIGQEDKFLLWNLDPMVPFKPVVEHVTEKAFLPYHPIDIIKSGNVAKIPFVTGLATQDGAIKSPGVYGKPDMLEEINNDFNRVAPITLLYHNTAPDKDVVSELIRNFCFGNKEINDETVSQVTDMFTDSMFFAAEDETVRLHFEYLNQPVYYYLFGYKGSASFSPIFGDASRDYGVSHSDDLFYIFPIGELIPAYKPTESDKQVAEIMTTLWTNFAKTGNPTPEMTSKIKVKWEPIQSDDLEYYYIKRDSDLSMSKNMFIERAKFWRSLPISSRRIMTKDEL